jgi:hypothetical protein
MVRQKKITMDELKGLIAEVQISRDTTQLLEIMRDKSYAPETRLEAAEAAAPFHPVPISPIDDDEDE